MEKRLRALFDFQRFEGNSELQDVIDDVHARYAGRELDLDEMEMVNAAGSPEMQKNNKKPENDKK